MRALVLGGCGFIGSHIVDKLLASGMRVRVFDRYPEKFRSPLPSVDYRLGDFKDTIAVLEALADVDVVYHLISATFPGTAALDPRRDVSENILPTLDLLEAMAQSGIGRLVYLSSGGTVYGIPSVVPTPEDHPLRPIGSYGIVKATIEHYIELFSRERGISSTIIRPSNPYGPRQGHIGVQGVVATFLNRVLNGEALQIWGDGSVVRDYIFVEDLAALCVRAGSSRQYGVFNGGSGIGVSVNDIVAEISRVTGRSIVPEYSPGRAVDVPRSVLDMSRVHETFGWQPAISLHSGIATTWSWLATVRD
jgi:UDP-glucose 4-epimerase